MRAAYRRDVHLAGRGKYVLYARSGLADLFRESPRQKKPQVQQLEVPERDAKAALRQNQGDVTLALGQLVEPPSREELLASASRSGTRASRLVKV